MPSRSRWWCGLIGRKSGAEPRPLQAEPRPLRAEHPPSLQAEPPDPAGRAAAQTREQGRRRWCPRLAGGHVEAGGQVLRGGLTPAANEA